MQFLVIGRDGTDANAVSRRMAARAAHIALGDELVRDGRQLMGAAILEDGEMRGSVLLVDYPNREAVDEWLKEEPYVVGNVWQSITVEECRVGPSFSHLLERP